MKGIRTDVIVTLAIPLTAGFAIFALVIFERFFRTGRDAGGSGLGLAVTRELIEAHGGRVGADSTEGRTCIWFTP